MPNWPLDLAPARRNLWGMTHTIRAQDAALVLKWLQTRGGIAVWQSVNLSNLDGGWTTPATAVDGTPMPKPNWQAGEVPTIITDAAEVMVAFDREVKRFRVALRRGSQGLSVKVTDVGSRRIREAVAKAGKGAYYLFDYATQEAVIMAPTATVPILEWAATGGANDPTKTARPLAGDDTKSEGPSL